jgi:outer membrane immunogenic protein
MKRLLAATALLGILSAPAFAADLPAAQAYQPVSAAVYDWTGFYVGANVGYAWGEAEVTALGATDSGDYDGFVGGLQLGYNHQIGQFVVGLEVDAQLSGVEYDEAFAGGTASSELTWFGTGRARVGYAFDRFLPYITGGFAWAQNDIDFTVGGVTVSDDNNHFGWTVGGGLEAAVTENISVKAEYLYVALDGEDYFDGAVAGGFDADSDFHIGRVGLNYRF